MGTNTELLGLPASGKSTYCDTVQFDLAVYRADQAFSLFRVGWFFMGAISYFRIFMVSFQTIYHVPGRYFFFHLLAIFRLFSRIYEVRKLVGVKNVVLEEGVFQAVWGLFMLVEENTSTRVMLSKIVNELNFPKTHVIFISVDKEVVIKRNILRDKPNRFLVLIQRDEKKLVESSIKWMDLLMIQLKNNKLVDKIVYNG